MKWKTQEKQVVEASEPGKASTLGLRCLVWCVCHRRPPLQWNEWINEYDGKATDRSYDHMIHIICI